MLDVDMQHVQAIRASGLHITTDRGTRTVKPSAMRPEELAVAPDLLIVLTKQPQTVAALASVRPDLLAHSWVLTLQNGLGNVELIERFVPVDRLLVGVTTYPADLLGPGRVASHGEGQVRLMTADGVARPIAGQVEALFNSSGLNCRLDTELQAAIWAKVAFNAALNTICAVTGCRVGQVAETSEARQLALDVASEVAGVATQIGIDVPGDVVRDAVAHALDVHRMHKPSMLQDLLAGRPTEIAAINGAVVAAAERVGLDVPLTRTLFALVRLSERRRADELHE